jgi:hypothetical protein
MLSAGGGPARPRQRQLLRLFASLCQADQETLLAFAQFLAARGRPADEPPAPAEPVAIPRPARESVIGAIKRLAATYPMLDRGRMLNETSSLMTQHILHGRDAAGVIDELESLFRRHYEELRADPGAPRPQGESPEGV